MSSYCVPFWAVILPASEGLYVFLLRGWMDAFIAKCQHALACLRFIRRDVRLKIYCTMTYFLNLIMACCGLPFKKHNVNDCHFDDLGRNAFPLQRECASAWRGTLGMYDNASAVMTSVMLSSE